MTTNPHVRRLRDARRRLQSVLTANADRLSAPFTDAPDKNPWDTHVRPAMRALKAAVDAVAAAAVSVVPPATNRAPLRERIAETLWPLTDWDGDQLNAEAAADAVLAVLFGPIPAGTDIATWTAIRAIQLMNEAGQQRDAALTVLPAPVDQAAVYRQVADRLAADAEQGDKEGLTRIYRRSAAKQVRAWGEELRGPAVEERPRCSHCQMPHDLTPGSVPVAMCESVRRRIARAAELHAEGDHSLCTRSDCGVLRDRHLEAFDYPRDPDAEVILDALPPEAQTRIRAQLAAEARQDGAQS